MYGRDGMTEKEAKQRQKRQAYFEEKALLHKKARRRTAGLKILRALFLLLCIISILVTFLLPQGEKVLGPLSAAWFFSFSAWTSWKLAPHGMSASMVQVGRSGICKPIYHKNLSVALVSSVIAAFLTLILLEG